jgi:hypothetical protein
MRTILDGCRFVGLGLVLALAGCGEDPGTVRLTNSSSVEVSALSVSPDSAPQWGADLLASPIAVGTVRDVGPIEPGLYDVRAMAVDGRVIVVPGVTIVAGGTSPLTILLDTAGISVVNTTRSQISGVYWRRAGSTGWGRNQLLAPISDTGLHVFDIPPGRYDLRAAKRGAGGTRNYDRHGVNVHEGGTTTFTVH